MPYRYLTVEETIRENAYRHEAKGLWWTDQGFDEYARGSFRKAARNHNKADALKLDPMLAALIQPLRDLMAKAMLGD